MSENTGIIFKGKAMGQMLLDFEIKNVPNLVEKIEKKYRRQQAAAQSVSAENSVTTRYIGTVTVIFMSDLINHVQNYMKKS